MIINPNLNATFGKVSDTYDKTRPSYPPSFVLDAIETAKMTNQSSILEIGCGNGIATRQFAPHCKKLTAIDRSSELIEVARKNTEKFQNVELHVTSFENYNTTEKFDIIICATAWHWLDEKTKYQKVHSLLNENGFLILLCNQPWQESPELKKIKNLLVKHCPDYLPDFGLKSIAEIKNTPYFSLILEKETILKQKLATEDYVKLISTYSYVSILPEDKQNALFSEIKKLGLTLPAEFKSKLIICKKH